MILGGENTVLVLYSSIRFLTHVVSGYSGKDESRFQSGFLNFGVELAGVD